MQLRDKITKELLVLAVLLGFGFFINQGVALKGLYMDDLYLWSCYGEQSFREFVFPVGGTRFRFVFYLASWLELLLLGNHVAWMVPFNIILNALIAFSIYRIACSMSGGRTFVSLACGIAFLLSRMAYYQIGQFYGLMESLGLWAAVGMLYFLYRYANERNTGAYLLANLLYFLASFIHERYMALLPALLLALVFGRRKRYGRAERVAAQGKDDDSEEEEERLSAGSFRSRQNAQNIQGSRAERRSRGRRADMTAGTAAPKWLLLLVSIGSFALIQGIRLMTIGTLSPAGTGGTDVADTFEMADAIAHAWEQVGFVFGRGTGPDYLCVLPFEEAPDPIRTLTLVSNGVLAAAVLAFLVGVVRGRENILGHLKNVCLFLAFIALCIGSSSVTIRVEMRWVYVVYAAALVFLAYMSSVMGKAGILVFLYVGLLFPVETFYREQWSNLYFWPSQLQYNSLAEETIEKYGEEIFEKQVYVIGNTYEMSEFTAETFLKVYDKNGDAENTTIRFIDSDFDFKEIADDVVILREDVEHNAYQDVTDFVKQQRFNRAYGSYDDGWVDEHAKIVFMNGNTDKVTLSCYYPGTITGDEVCEIRVNGKRMPDLVFTDNLMYYEIEAAPYQMISLEFSCNFYVANARETRGEENLAMIVNIGAE